MVQLKPGNKAHGFKLVDQHGKDVQLSDFKGQKLLLYFYPKADTPGCTTQACNVRDAREDFKRLGIVAVGISPDTPKQQEKFDNKYGLGFPLLSDTDHAVADAYGVWGAKSMYGRKYDGITRSSFLIDEKGRIIGAWYKVSPNDTVPKAREALERESKQ